MSSFKLFKSRKAQQAMEFLFMHGWSLLVSLIVGIIIIALVVGTAAYVKNTGHLPDPMYWFHK